MYTSLVDVANISPSLILRLLKAAETYQVVQAVGWLENRLPDFYERWRWWGKDWRARWWKELNLKLWYCIYINALSILFLLKKILDLKLNNAQSWALSPFAWNEKSWMIDLDALSFAPHFPSPAQVEYLTIAEELNMVDLKAVALKYYYHAFNKWQNFISRHMTFIASMIFLSDLSQLIVVLWKRGMISGQILNCVEPFGKHVFIFWTLWKACFHLRKCALHAHHPQCLKEVADWHCS